MSGLLGDRSEQNQNSLQNSIMANGSLNNNGTLINASTVNINSNVKKFSSLEQNYKDLVEKVQNGENIDSYLSDINIYLELYQRHSTRDIRNLEEKLLASDREDEIDEALLSKELATKFIIETEQNQVIRYLIANILYLIKKNFTNFITPLIKEGRSQYEINIAIDIHILRPIEETISQTEFSAHFKQINNFLYFLAGNCHICWDK
ncbi:ABC-three component system protein [Acinetobacter baumannii]|uniref:ABC-three component system protein n=1 Tax=Acinetobacter baumannii TaxID=470 RepID=UPI002958245A|nr:ABC-three component system protein [Acinetobacter baumannii]